MATKKYATIIELGGKLGSSFQNSTKALKTGFGGIKKEISSLEAKQDKLNKFKLSTKQTVEAKRAWSDAQKKVAELSNQIKNTEKPSKALNAEFQRAKKVASAAKNSYYANQKSLHDMRGELKSAGIDTKNLTSQQNKLNKKMATAKTRSKVFGAIAKGAGTAKVAVMGLATAAAAVSAALGVVAVATFGGVRKIATYGDEVAKTSNRLDMGVESLQEWQYVNQIAGGSQEELNKSLEKMSKNLGEAKAGTGTLTTYLKKSDPALLKQLKSTKSNEEAFELLMTAIEKTTDANKKAALANAAFGRSGKSVINMANQGAEAIAKLKKEARENGNILSDEEAKNAEAFNDALLALQSSFGGILNVVGTSLMPTLTSLFLELRTSILENKEEIKAFVTTMTGIFKDLIPVFKVVGQVVGVVFKALVVGLRETIKYLKPIVEWVSNSAVGKFLGGMFGNISKSVDSAYNSTSKNNFESIPKETLLKNTAISKNNSNVNQKVDIQVLTHPNQNPKEIAQEVQKTMQKNKPRGLMYDPA